MFSHLAIHAVSGQIDTTIGQAQLLMSKKGRFKQFGDLVDNCEFGRGEKETTCQDLQGFWDMVYFQVFMTVTYSYICMYVCMFYC